MKLRWIMALALALVAVLFVTWRVGEAEVARPEVTEADPSTALEPSLESPTLSAVEQITEPQFRSGRNAVAPSAPPPANGEPSHAGIRLYGNVRAGNGDEALVPAVDIVITDSLGEAQRTTVDAAHNYSVTGLAPGRHWIVCGAGEWGKVQRTIELKATERERRLDLQLQFDTDLRVEVVDLGGQPIPKLPLMAVASTEAPGEWIDEVLAARTDAIGVGRWIPEGRAADSAPTALLGQIRLRMPPPIHVSLVHHQRVVATQLVEAGKDSVRFVLDPLNPLLQRGSLRMRVIDAESGQGLPDVAVQITDARWPLHSKTRPDGTLSGPALPGWIGIKIRYMDYETAEVVVRVEPAIETNLGDIALQPSVSISGRVVDDKGIGAVGVLVHEPLTAVQHASGRFMDEIVRTSEDGTFKIELLSRRQYRLRFRHDSEAFAANPFEVDLRLGSIDDARLQLVRGTPLVVSASDDRWPLVHYDVIGDGGTKVVSSRLLGLEPSKILLAPGRYEVEVRIGQSIESPRRVITIANEPVALSLP